jgi:hypothetical protein
MKIDIGPYTNYIGPYQIAEKILFWKDKNKINKTDPFENHPDATAIYKLGDILDSIPGFTTLCTWIDSKKKRRVKIHIDDYDVWAADNTLAMIIHPVLVKLKEQKHGSPDVDDEDVPEHLRSTAATPLTEEEKNTGHIDDLWVRRWDWVLDEMIWAFGEHANPEWDMQFCSGVSDLKVIDGNLVNGPNDTFKIDMNTKELHIKRMENGRRLFAKYYFALWD